MKSSPDFQDYASWVSQLMSLRGVVLGDPVGGTGRLPCSSQHVTFHEGRWMCIGSPSGEPLVLPVATLRFDLSGPVGFVEAMSWCDFIVTASAVRRRLPAVRREVLEYCDALWEAGMTDSFLSEAASRGLAAAVSQARAHPMPAVAERAMREAARWGGMPSVYERRASEANWAARVGRVAPGTGKAISKHLMETSLPPAPVRGRKSVDKSVLVG